MSGTMARLVEEGHAVTVVCATRGEVGEISDPALATPETLGQVREQELRDAMRELGVEDVRFLDYRDSGMAGTPENEHPECFARADLDEAVRRLVAVIRRTRPQVIVTYGDDQQAYPHPDHLRVHDISLPAFDLAGDPGAYPEAGEPWQPSKLYYTAWSRARMVSMHEKFLELGLESPFSEEWLNRPSNDDRVTTRIDVSDFMDVRRDALLAHATQIDPASPFWFGLPPQAARTVYPLEEYVLARTRVPVPEGGIEDDLFAGCLPDRRTGATSPVL